MVVINDLPEKVVNIESDCLIANLQAFDCRKGCPNCSANELFCKLEKVYEQAIRIWFKRKKDKDENDEKCLALQIELENIRVEFRKQ